jgi:hypothetical protein
MCTCVPDSCLFEAVCEQSDWQNIKVACLLAAFWHMSVSTYGVVATVL